MTRNIAAEEGERNSTGLPIFRPPKGQPFAPQSSREPGLVPQVGKDNDMEDIFGASEPAPSQEGSAWDRIRNANMGKQSEWDKIRQGEADLSELQRDPATNSSSWDKVRHADSDNFFIDSALSESSGGTSNKARFSKDNISVKRNKYGDIIELPDESLKDVKYNN
ncbi:hypothetical protein L0F63_002378 [Massospora cicadina]|nr:hypothetical protein L0F63_002378 [Massospora cicadina]